jgi:AcrR family transcriptional regulator
MTRSKYRRRFKEVAHVMVDGKVENVSLRDRLIDLSEQQIENTGHEPLSLRALASAAGVAPSAPYRHFAGRTALLQCLAERGFGKLLVIYTRASKIDDSSAKRLAFAVRGFIKFARAQPNLFRLMFSPDILRLVGSNSAAITSFEIFQTLVAQNTSTSRQSSPRLITTLSLWSAMHGAALLDLDGHFSRAAGGTLTIDDIIGDIIARFQLPR